MAQSRVLGDQSLRAGLEALRMALRDLWHDRRTTLVLVFTVGAIVAPLLLLFGLKNGVVSTLRASLLQDPHNLEVVVYGSTRLDRGWFRAYAARSDVGFLVPKTRTINATVDLINAKRHIVRSVEVIPTAPGDPLLPMGLPVPRRAGEVLITATLAGKLRAQTAQPLSAVIKRTLGGRPQNASLPLEVIGVIPETSFARDALFTTVDLLAAAEDYRDGVLDRLDDLNALSGYAERRDHFANARIYAADLDAVAPLAAAMRAEGIEIRTQAEKIATVQAFDRILSFVFRVIAAIGSLGCALALGGALWVNVERKRRHLALMRLFGFGNAEVAAIPLTQSLVITCGGFALAFGAYLVGSGIFNRVMGENLLGGGYVCRLQGPDLLMAGAFALVMALLAASAGALRAGRITPAESLRDV
jgi:putative ABC transport system permease protein